MCVALWGLIGGSWRAALCLPHQSTLARCMTCVLQCSCVARAPPSTLRLSVCASRAPSVICERDVYNRLTVRHTSHAPRHPRPSSLTPPACCAARSSSLHAPGHLPRQTTRRRSRCDPSHSAPPHKAVRRRRHRRALHDSGAATEPGAWNLSRKALRAASAAGVGARLPPAGAAAPPPTRLPPCFCRS